MKYKIMLSFALLFFTTCISFVASLHVVYAEKLPNCTELKGTISVTDWPADATIDVACSGDQGPSGCHGQVQKGLKSGDSFDLNQCTCPPYGDGCLKVGTNLGLSDPHDSPYGPIVDVTGDIGVYPGSCSIDDTSNFCSSNYVDADKVPFWTVTGSCPKPTPACRSACTDNNNCAGEVNGCTQCLPDNGSSTGKSCQPTPTTPPNQPACNTACNPANGNKDCQNAINGCTTCNSTTRQCSNPGSTPAPTPPPACNSSCVKDSDCTGDAAKNGCSACISNKCSKPGTTPAPTPPPACNSSCVKDSDCTGDAAKNGCNVCLSNKCSKPGSTPTPPPACNTTCQKDSDCAGAKDSCTSCNTSSNKCVPAATPTPTFNANWCSCDGLDSTPPSFFPGDNVTFISYGKVEAPYLDRAKVTSIDFAVYRGTDVQADRVAYAAAIPSTLDSQSSTKNRYKSTWSYKIPTDIKKGEIFKVESHVNCAPQNVLGVSIHYQPSLIDRVVQFVGYIFGLSPQPVATDYQSSPTPTEPAMVNNPTPQVLAAQNSLQIGTFTEAKIIEKSCRVVRFTFGN